MAVLEVNIVKVLGVEAVHFVYCLHWGRVMLFLAEWEWWYVVEVEVVMMNLNLSYVDG